MMDFYVVVFLYLIIMGKLKLGRTWATQLSEPALVGICVRILSQGRATEVVVASEGKKKVMLIWTAGESWSRRDSLKVFRLGVVGEEGLMQVLKTISVFIWGMLLCLFFIFIVIANLYWNDMSEWCKRLFFYRWRN